MTPEKFFRSQQTLNTDRVSSSNSFNQIKKYSSQIILNPYTDRYPLKFPKNKTVRKQTQVNTLTESIQNPQRLSIRPFTKANKHTLQQIPQIKRIAKSGTYNPLSRSVDSKDPEPRTFSDIGLKNNMKRVQYIQKYKPDPIIIGDVSNLFNKSNSNLLKKERMLRDNGKQAKEILTWEVNNNRKKILYSQKPASEQLEHNKSNIFPNTPIQKDYSRVLNYESRK